MGQSFSQLLGIERGNPIGIFVLLTVTLATLGWWAYAAPATKAAKALVDLRQKFADWQAAEMGRYDQLWAEKVELMKRCEALEGKLARWKSEHKIPDE